MTEREPYTIRIVSGALTIGLGTVLGAVGIWGLRLIQPVLGDAASDPVFLWEVVPFAVLGGVLSAFFVWRSNRWVRSIRREEQASAEQRVEGERKLVADADARRDAAVERANAAEEEAKTAWEKAIKKADEKREAGERRLHEHYRGELDHMGREGMRAQLLSAQLKAGQDKDDPHTLMVVLRVDGPRDFIRHIDIRSADFNIQGALGAKLGNVKLEEQHFDRRGSHFLASFNIEIPHEEVQALYSRSLRRHAPAVVMVKEKGCGVSYVMKEDDEERLYVIECQGRAVPIKC